MHVCLSVYVRQLAEKLGEYSHGLSITEQFLGQSSNLLFFIFDTQYITIAILL